MLSNVINYLRLIQFMYFKQVPMFCITGLFLIHTISDNWFRDSMV